MATTPGPQLVRNQECFPGLPSGCKSPSTWAIIIHCLPLSITRELHWKQNIQDSSQHPLGIPALQAAAFTAVPQCQFFTRGEPWKTGFCPYNSEWPRVAGNETKQRLTYLCQLHVRKCFVYSEFLRAAHSEHLFMFYFSRGLGITGEVVTM